MPKRRLSREEELREAAWRGDLGALSRLLAESAELGELAVVLQAAVYLRDLEQARWALERGADANLPPEPGDDAPLVRAAEEAPRASSTLAMVRLLVEAGADLEARGSLGLTPLLNAVGAVAREQRRGEIDSAIWEDWVTAFEAGTGTATIDRAAAGGSDTEQSDARLRMIDQLLELGASPEARDAEECSAPMLAAVDGDVALVDALLARGFAADDVVNVIMVQSAAAGNLAMVERCLRLGADPNRRICRLGTALTVAAQDGHLDVVSMLLRAGADPNRGDSADEGSGMLPLHRAAGAGHLAVVRCLLEAGADATREDASGGDASMAAEAGKRLGYYEDRQWDEVIAVLREARRAGPPRLEGAAIANSTSIEVLAAVAELGPVLAGLSWRTVEVAGLRFYESSEIEAAAVDWFALRAATSRLGFAPVLTTHDSEQLQRRVDGVETLLEAFDAETGRTAIERIGREARWAKEMIAGVATEKIPKPFRLARFASPRFRHHIVLSTGSPETVAVVYNLVAQDHDEATVASFCAHWRQRYGAELAYWDNRMAHLAVADPPTDEDAIRAVARELILVSPAIGRPRDALAMATSRTWTIAV
jgi:hypothetical protein